jgi:glycosyltransferase involved in cell wall biosynthesis
VEATQSGVVPIAYAHAKPVVATRVGSLPECVDDGRTGLLVPPRDEHALAKALIRLLQDDELRREMGAAGRQKLNEECSDEVIAAKHIEVYRRAVQARLRPAMAELNHV